MIKKLKSKLIAFFVSLFLIIIAIYLANLFKNGDNDIFIVARNDLVVSINVSGKVVPGQEIDLSFETSGKVSVINAKIGDEVKEGDILARLNSAQIDSEIEEALADLKSQEAKLAEISGGDSLQGKLESARQSLISVLKKSYISADDVVRNSVDLFFDNLDTSSPEFSKALADYYIRQDIQTQRKDIEKTLSNWKDEANNLTSDEVTLTDAEDFVANLKKIEALLSTISSGSGKFGISADKTQAQIDAYIAGISQARITIASLIVDINSATEAVRSVQAETPVLSAAIISAQAVIDRLTAKSDSYVIRAPFDGIITDKDVELGVVVSSGEKVFSMVGKQPLEIESFVPEVNIAGVDIGDPAKVSLDAFDEGTGLAAAVSHIDPRETVKDGVTTYRILLQFNEFNPDVLSGMSTEIQIEKDRIRDQIVIPRYLITTEGDKSFVTVLSLGKKNSIEVTLGQRDSSGNVAINSGLSIGDKIVVPR
ncbi:MAG TPA: efflux RND transporter periplasmic adaptor subunit [Candidatus Paceibacterota bacterium]|nr:efflux RND transporter periplasmic adaptor subunit [Candidatus Paceibacterota bacterium]HRZ34434.1 efflux RND transporter periplasmic adaptor subunit [Candidatus Paceibacterota bacterium]